MAEHNKYAKALKSVLVKKKITFRFVHDIDELIVTLGKHGSEDAGAGEEISYSDRV